MIALHETVHKSKKKVLMMETTSSDGVRISTEPIHTADNQTNVPSTATVMSQDGLRSLYEILYYVSEVGISPWMYKVPGGLGRERHCSLRFPVQEERRFNYSPRTCQKEHRLHEYKLQWKRRLNEEREQEIFTMPTTLCRRVYCSD